MLTYGLNQNGYTVLNCQKNVKEIVIPATYKGKPVTEISDYAFANCINLKSITIPDSVTRIGRSSFYDCINLKDIVIPSGVTTIGSFTFDGCKNLQNVTIPNSVTSIGNGAFHDCTNLQNITIPDSVTEIGISTFGNCTNLQSITIPDSVKVIYLRAFVDCQILTSKPRIYKAFKIQKDETLVCRDMTYHINEWNECSDELELCKNGLHYCTNLFEIFNYYFGILDEDIAICECEVGGEILTSNTSKCCARRLKPVKRLTRQEIINILNGEE